MGKEKNQAMVNAFGTGKPPVLPTPQNNSLSTRSATRAGGVRKRGESKEQMKQRLYGEFIGFDNSDIDAIFRGVQNIRTNVRRGLSGAELNPDGSDPGNSFDRFMRQNPHLQGAAGRQQQNDEQARNKFNMLFPGNAKSSPPGGASGGRVGPTQASGEPGGDTLFGQMPEYKSPGMPVDYNRELGYGPNSGPQADWNNVLGYQQPNQGPQPNWNAAMNYGPNAGPQRYATGPNEGPQRPSDFGPQLPYSSGEQLMALKRLSGFGGNNNPTLTALEGLWSNLFPGNDYDYLQQLFPGLVHPQSGSGQTMTQLAKMYQNPAYQALFPQVNQSEFYK